MKKITSSTNPIFRELKSLHTKKGITQEKGFILSGKKLVLEILEGHQQEIVCEIISDGMNPLTKKAISFSPSLFNELDLLGTHYNLIVLRLPQLEHLEELPPVQGRELILPLGDPSNLGAVIRSAVAFGIDRIFLTAESASPFLPKAVRASAGAVLKAQMMTVPSLRSLNFTNNDYALDLNGQDLTKINQPQHFRLLVGEEGQGVPTSFAGQRLTIKTSAVESLNATVAASIAIWQLTATTRHL